MPTHAVVTLAALDLRHAPDHRGELASQLLMGETVRLLSAAARRGWWRVRNDSDGYEGWVREWGLVLVSGARAGNWRRLASGRVAEPFVTVTAGRISGLAVSPLFLGGRVILGRLQRGRRAVELPDGRRGWVPAAAFRGRNSKPPSLVWRVTSLLGTPYLWGGRTPAGMDCSAFTQVVLEEQGITLPRDARDQQAACTPVPDPSDGVEGDLAFFATPGKPVSHVGIALGGGYFAHSRGMVCISSIVSSNKLWDNGLAKQFVGWFRPGSISPAGRRRSPSKRIPA